MTTRAEIRILSSAETYAIFGVRSDGYPSFQGTELAGILRRYPGPMELAKSLAGGGYWTFYDRYDVTGDPEIEDHSGTSEWEYVVQYLPDSQGYGNGKPWYVQVYHSGILQFAGRIDEFSLWASLHNVHTM